MHHPSQNPQRLVQSELCTKRAEYSKNSSEPNTKWQHSNMRRGGDHPLNDASCIFLEIHQQLSLLLFLLYRSKRENGEGGVKGSGQTMKKQNKTKFSCLDHCKGTLSGGPTVAEIQPTHHDWGLLKRIIFKY